MTNHTVKGSGYITQRDIDDAEKVCEHLSVGNLAHFVGEQDSFGPVTRYWYCTECYKEFIRGQLAQDLDSVESDPEEIDEFEPAWGCEDLLDLD